jgi:BirA family biotin operon repressor/biotin-[acetyl-CoA-carboxylase] ligase
VVASLAACETCREHCGDGAVVEWPNDVMFGRGKLGGILVEMRSVGRRPLELVVGVGLNVNHRRADFPPELRESATSLRLSSRRGMLELESVAAGLLNRLGRAARRMARGDWEELVRDWEAVAPSARGCRVRVAPGAGSGAECEPWEGITRGLDADGALSVERADGRVVAVHLVESVAVVG